MKHIYFTTEYILIYLILAIILPFSYLSASGGNYRYSIPLILLGIIYISLYRKNHDSTNFKKIIVCFLTLTVLTSFSYFVYNIQYTSYFQFLANAIAPFISFLVFYTYSLRKKDEKILILFFIIYYIVGVYYINYQQSIRISFLQQINNFYFIITPLPILFLIERPLIRSLLIVISSFCVIISLKRSGFVIIILLTLYTAYYYLFSKMNYNRRILFIVFFVLLGAYAYRYSQSWNVNYYDRIIERMDAIEEDRGSGRATLAEESVVLILNMNPIQMLIGKGYSAIDSERYSTGYNTFHNDYSEATYSYGIIGLILFVGMVVCVFKKMLYSCKYKSRYRFAITSSLIILIVFSFTSSVMHYTYFMLPLFIFWGYMEPKMRRKISN